MRIKIKRIVYLSVLFLGASFLTLFVYLTYPSFYSRKKPASGVRFLEANIFVESEIAADAYTWAKGLMFRQSLEKNKGMLFIFPDEKPRSFWMKNVYMALDVIFISADKKVIDIKENFQPCTSFVCDSYVSKGAAMYVLEVEAGFAGKNSIKTGDRVEVY